MVPVRICFFRGLIYLGKNAKKTTCLALQSREEGGKSGVGRATAFLQQETFA
jgi:hypothetical protein